MKIELANDSETKKDLKPAKYVFSLLVYESTDTENTSIKNSFNLEEYKNKMKDEILQKILKKLNENEKQHLEEEKKTDSPLNLNTENQEKLKKGESSDEIISSEENEEKAEKSKIKPTRDLQYYVEIWKKHSKYGEPIENTYLIPSKTFYMSKKAEILQNTPYYYSLIDCVEEHKAKGIKIEKIIDINYSNKYYNFYYLKKKYGEQLFGIEYIKIPLKPKELPTRKELNRIYDILNKNISKKQYILIHCTHGVSRTGYVIIYFLCKRFEMSLDRAIQVFEKSRGHKFDNETLINDLKQKIKI